MTTPTAGWYPDPDGTSRSRWWNGVAWTDSYSDPQPAAAVAAPATFVAPEPAVAPVAYAAPASPTATSPYLASVNAAQLKAPAGTLWSTVWIWLLVFVPLLPMIGLLFIDFNGIFSYSNITDEAAMTIALITSPAYLLMLFTSWIVYGLSVLFSVLDYRELTRRSVPNPFHWAFAFISSAVYVIGRSVVVRRRTGKGISPMWVTIVAYIVVNILVFAYMIWVLIGVFADLPSFR